MGAGRHLPRRAAGKGPREHGVALMMVLWVIVLLSVIALNFLRDSRWNSLSTRNLKDETISYYMALSGYHEALNYLMSDKDPSFDYTDGEGNFWIDKESRPVTGKRTLPEGVVDIRILDEDARVNINFASPERLKMLFSYAGIPEEKVTEILESMADWRDPDKEHHLSGAEDDYYEGLEDPYKAKNGLFDVPEELSLVRGILPEYLHGSSEFKALLPMITTFGRGALNINTVSREVMELIGLEDIEIEAVFKQRTEEAGGFRFIPQQFAARGLNAIATNSLRIEVTAQAHDNPSGTKIEAVVIRQQTATGYRLQTIYWREGAENTRS